MGDPLSWLKLWPFFLMFMTMGPFNIDLVVIPSLTNGGVHILFWTFKLPSIFPKFSPTQVFVIATVLSIAFTIYFYWFLGWFFREYSKSLATRLADKEPIKEGLQLWKQLPREIRRRVKNYCTSLHDWATNEDNKVVRRLRRGGYPAIFFLSMIPEPGLRTGTTIFARSLGTKTALVMVILGETAKNAVVLGLWNLVFWIF